MVIILSSGHVGKCRRITWHFGHTKQDIGAVTVSEAALLSGSLVWTMTERYIVGAVVFGETI
jgi:hypothetical protein